jgi:riboflavin kinase / FMN adenylyltransferase
MIIMHLIRGLHNLKKQFTNGCVATIGNYDGVHLGHQQILARLKEKAKELKLPTLVIIFEPQPEEFFGDYKSVRLTSLREKIFLFIQEHIDETLVLTFNQHLADITAKDFIEKVLIDSLHVRYLIIGDDFAFGRKRLGDFALLNKYANRGLKVEKMPPFRIEGVRVSSSFIRNVLLQGNLNTAAKFLGRPYQIKTN